MNSASGAELGSWLQGWLSKYALEISLLLVVLLVVQSLRLLLERTRAARRVAAHRRVGVAGEKRARKMLKRAGYQIVKEQAVAAYQLMVDESPVKVQVRADFVVQKSGRLFIAEVKGGKESAKITGRATRRQLLEYQVAFDVHGILLVDAYSGSLQRVSFPGLV